MVGWGSVESQQGFLDGLGRRPADRPEVYLTFTGLDVDVSRQTGGLSYVYWARPEASRQTGGLSYGLDVDVSRQTGGLSYGLGVQASRQTGGLSYGLGRREKFV
jgi:hypothetical protein